MIFKSYEIQKQENILTKNNLYLLYGENFGLKKDIKEFIKKLINVNDPNMEIFSVYENEIINNEENFYNLVYSGSLFSSKKIITIYEASDKIIEKIKNIYEKYPENTFLILFSDILDKKSKLRNFFEKSEKTICIPCYLDTDRDLMNITQNELIKNNISISKEAVNLIIEKSNADRSNLRSEIEKIKAYAYKKNKLHIDEIKSLINFSGEYKSEVLINECLCGNISQYKKILSEIYENTLNQVFLFRILNNKIHRLISIKEKGNNENNLDNIINTLKPAIFWKEKPLVKKQLLLWSVEELKKIIDETNNIELLCKKNPINSKIIFFNFFSGICKKASNFS